MADPVTLAFDVAPDQRSAAIAAAGPSSSGRPVVDVIDHRPGTDWLIGRLDELVRKHKPVALLFDPAGPAGSFVQDITKAKVGIEPRTVSGREMAQACSAFVRALDDRALEHVNQHELNDALNGARKRSAGVDLWAWDRKNEQVDICPLVAVTLAVWGAASAPPPKRKPVFGTSRPSAPTNEVFRPSSRLRL